MRYLMICFAVLGLAACSEPAEPPEPQAYDPASDVIGAPLHQALDEAGSVEDLNAGRKDELEEAINAGE